MSDKINKFLQLEENEELFQFKYTDKNILMYPVIRTFLFESIKEELYNYKYQDAQIKSFFVRLIYIFKAFFYRPPSKLKTDILIFDTDLSNLKQGKNYFNFVSDYFANEYPDKTVIFEGSHKLNFRRPRTFIKVYAHDYLLLKALIRSKFKKINRKDTKQIDLFLDFLRKSLKEKFDFEFSNNSTWNKLKKLLIRGLKRMSLLYDEHLKCFKKLAVKIILLKNGCYGGYNKIPIIMAAKDLNIPVGEHAHSIPAFVVFYNYSKNLHDSYKYYLPNFFMTTSKSSLKMLNMPVKIYLTGFPYLNEKIKNYELKKENHIVYMSGRYEPETYIEEVIFLKNKLSVIGCSISFRIHPQEMERINTVYKPILDAGIAIDSRATKDLYDSLSTSKYVVSGGVSTTLYEALAFGCIVFLKDTPLNSDFIDITQFNVYKSKEDITDKILKNNYNRVDASEVLVQNWKEEYHKLVDSVCP